MSNLAEYFSKNRYHPKWLIGDRVFGYYNKIPFIGSVGNDSVVSEIEGPRVTVHLDLPIKVDKKYISFIIVKPKELKRLVELDDLDKSSVRVSNKIGKK